MRDSLVPAPAAPSRPLPAIVVGGLIVGVLDIAYAIVVYSPHHPLLLLQGIASGLLGRDSYNGGASTAVLGLVLHFIIALGAATVYYLASRKLPILISRAVVCGMIYGALVFFFMHGVVIPLSAIHKGRWLTVHMAFEFVEHWFFVGLPIALSVRHFAPTTSAEETTSADNQ